MLAPCQQKNKKSRQKNVKSLDMSEIDCIIYCKGEEFFPGLNQKIISLAFFCR